MLCRPGCGACCVAPSISSPIPGMPNGKPAGVPCIHLDGAFRCRIFDASDRPKVCGSLKPHREMCGLNRRDALTWLENAEIATRP